MYLASFLRSILLLFISNNKLTVTSSSNNIKKNNKHEYHWWIGAPSTDPELYEACRMSKRLKWCRYGINYMAHLYFIQKNWLHSSWAEKWNFEYNMNGLTEIEYNDKKQKTSYLLDPNKILWTVDMHRLDHLFNFYLFFVNRLFLEIFLRKIIDSNLERWSVTNADHPETII